MLLRHLLMPEPSTSSNPRSHLRPRLLSRSSTLFLRTLEDGKTRSEWGLSSPCYCSSRWPTTVSLLTAIPTYWLRRWPPGGAERWKTQRDERSWEPICSARVMVGLFCGSWYIFGFSCVRAIKTSDTFSLSSIDQIHQRCWMLLWPMFLIRSDGVRNNHFVFENVGQTGFTSPQVCSVVLSVKATPLNVTHAWHPMRRTATSRAPPPALNMLTPAPPSQDPVSKHTPGKDSHTSVIWPVLVKLH